MSLDDVRLGSNGELRRACYFRLRLVFGATFFGFFPIEE